MLRDFLGLEGIPVGRRHVSTLMRKMGIEALYRRPNTRRKQPGNPVFPVPTARLGHPAGEPCVGHGHHLHPDAQRLRLPGCGTRLGDPAGTILAAVQQHDDRLLH